MIHIHYQVSALLFVTSIFSSQTAGVPISAVTDTADFGRFQDTKTILSDGNAPVYVALIQILTAYLAYIFGTSTTGLVAGEGSGRMESWMNLAIDLCQVGMQSSMG